MTNKILIVEEHSESTSRQKLLRISALTCLLVTESSLKTSATSDNM